MTTMQNSNSDDYTAYLQYGDQRDLKILKMMLLQSTSFQKCIVCDEPIEQPWSGGRVRRFCDRAGCRKRGNRIMRRFQRWQWERKTTARLRQYWQELLPDTQQELEKLLSNRSRWVTTESEESVSYHRSVDVSDNVTSMIDAERRAAWRKVERFTVVFEQRAERAEERVEALEQELKQLRQLLPDKLHDEIKKQPTYTRVIDAITDPQTLMLPAGERSINETLRYLESANREELDDRQRTLDTLAQAGIQPYSTEQDENEPEEEIEGE